MKKKEIEFSCPWQLAIIGLCLIVFICCLALFDIEKKLENIPKRVCHNETFTEKLVLNNSKMVYWTLINKSMEVICEEGVIVSFVKEGHKIKFDIYEYCGLPMTIEQYKMGDYSDNNTIFWDRYFKCKNETQKVCIITRTKEVCEIV